MRSAPMRLVLLAACLLTIRCDEEYEFYREYIEEKFPLEGPSLFGLHNNAEIGFLLTSCDSTFSIITDISGGSGGGVSWG